MVVLPGERGGDVWVVVPGGAEPPSDRLRQRCGSSSIRPELVEGRTLRFLLRCRAVGQTGKCTALSRFALRGRRGCPAAPYFFCPDKRSRQEKPPQAQRPCGLPCASRRDGRLRNSPPQRACGGSDSARRHPPSRLRCSALHMGSPEAERLYASVGQRHEQAHMRIVQFNDMGNRSGTWTTILGGRPSHPRMPIYCGGVAVGPHESRRETQDCRGPSARTV